MNPGIEDDVGAFAVPSGASSGPGSPGPWTGAEMTAQGMRRRLATWRSICVPAPVSGLRGDDGVLDDEMIVGDQRLDVIYRGPP